MPSRTTLRLLGVAVATVVASLSLMPAARATFDHTVSVGANAFGTAVLAPPSSLAVTTSCSGGSAAVAPAFVAASTTSGSGSTVTVPGVSGVQSGDLLLAQIAADDTTAVSATGWNLIREDKDNNEGFWQAVLYRVATGSEPANYSFTLTQSPAGEYVAGISAYRGVSPTTPIDTHGGQITTWPPGTNTVTAPSVTTTVANTRLVAFFGTDAGDPLTTPGGMTARWARQINVPQDAAGASADEARPSAGATGARLATRGGSLSNGIGQVVALRPAPGVSASVTASLSWTASPSSFASGYRLQRWRAGALEHEQTLTPASATSASDGPLLAGQAYEYRLVAVFQNWTSTTVVHALTPTCPTQQLVLWSRDGVNTPFATELATWSPSTQATAAVGRWRVLQAAAAPSRDEVIAVGIRTDGAITGQMRTAGTWAPLAANPLATGRPAGWVAEVAYESLSGDALLVWANGTTGTTPLSYRVWNGATWSATATITAPLAGEATHVELASNPGADEMIATVGNAAADDYALVWDGSQWATGASQVLDDNGVGSGTETSVAYEQQSGDALVTYVSNGVSSDDLRYRTWNGSWGGEQSLVSPATSSSPKPMWTELAASPTTDRLALGVLTDGGDAWAATWTGSAWVDATLLTTNASTSQGPGIAVAFEALSGEALVTFSIGGGSSFGFRGWSPGAGWTAACCTVTAISGVPHAMSADGLPGSNQIVVGVQDDLSTLTYLLWNGSGGWVVATNPLMENDTGEVDLAPFTVLWG